MAETFAETLNRYLLEGKTVWRAIQLAEEANPKGYEEYIREILKEDEGEIK
jgi:hypothetical protein